MRKKDIETCIKMYLPLIMGTAFTCLLVFLSHSSRAKMIAFESCPKISSFEKDFNKIADIIHLKAKGCAFSKLEGKQSKHRKKFRMGGNSYIEFKAAETFVYKTGKHLQDLTISYHTPNVVTAVVLFLHRLTSF